MLLSEASSAGGYFNLVPWVVFFPVIGLLINAFFGGLFLKTGQDGRRIGGRHRQRSRGPVICDLHFAGSFTGEPSRGAGGGPGRLDNHW